MTKTPRAPEPLNEAVAKVMRSNRSKNTGPEKIARRILRENGFPGYRLNWKKAPGKPDIAYPGRKIAIFVNGCFWHRCPLCNMPLPKSHLEYWKPKFERNVERDKINYQKLKAMGWFTVIIWECQIRKDPEAALKETLKLLESQDQS